MTPTPFPECNARFGPPEDMAESQVMTIPAYIGEVNQGSVDGSTLVVVAWRPSPAELERIKAGQPIYLSMLGGLAPHFLSTSFAEATRPA